MVPACFDVSEPKTHMPASACRCSVRFSISRAPYVQPYTVEPEPGSPGGPHRGGHVRRLANRHVSPAPASISARTLAHMEGGRAARSRHAARPHRPSHYHRETHSLLKHFAQFPQIWEMCVYTHHWLMALRMRDCLAHCNLEFAVVFSVLKPFRPALKQNIFLIIEYNISAFEIQPIITD